MPEYRVDSRSSEFNSDELDALLEACRALLKNREFSQTVREIFRVACDITGAKAGCVALLDFENHQVEVVLLDSGGLPSHTDPDQAMNIDGFRNMVRTSGYPVFENDFMNSKWADYLPEGHVELRNVLFTPLVIHGETRGFMALANKESDFHDRDVKMVAAFSEFAAVALINKHTMDRLTETVTRLKGALDRVKQLQGIISICSNCKKIRDKQGSWEQLEAYIREHSDAEFSHSLCPDCAQKLYKDLGESGD